MPGLSIARWRKAWLKGVAYGASGKGKCLYHVDKLKDIFQKGILHGRTNSGTPYVRAVVEQEQRRRFPLGRQDDSAQAASPLSGDARAVSLRFNDGFPAQDGLRPRAARAGGA